MPKPVPLNRTFSSIAKDDKASDEEDFSLYWGFTKPKEWSDLEAEYRLVILADAGAGKTYEMMARAQYLSNQGKAAFFIRIEDIDSEFRCFSSLACHW